MPVFSLIIPTLNSANTLSSALESIIQQSFIDLEILIMDGLSTDKTLEIIKSYSDFRIVTSSEKDNGIYDAMNKGILKSNGDWLYFMGSDDILYDNNVLAQIYSVIQSTNHKVIYGNVRVTGDAGWASDGTIYDGCFLLEKLLSKNICHQSIFYNRKIFEKIGKYDLKYPVWSDWEFNLRAWSKYKFKYSDIIVARFKGGSKSYSIQDNSFLLNRSLIIYNYFKLYLYKREFSNYLPTIVSHFKSIRQGNFLKYFFVRIQSLLNRYI
jgi:glycosyltransferase involved in cell wall biosynthesis